MRTVARMELPSTRAAMTWACLAGVMRFMMTKEYGIPDYLSRHILTQLSIDFCFNSGMLDG